ncbi:MAG TPA: Mur ligase family protein, partial [Desulfurivibrionaceae bacterium]|nr:Mur ligase family protein [Desulfurivibrionaceae bacterium]
MIQRLLDPAKKHLYRYSRPAVHLLRFWLALVHSKRLKQVGFVGITGSAGKTTAKDLSAAILSTAGECYSTPSSMNYPDGIARILLKVSRRHRFCVMEVSGGHPGELDRPLKLFTPTIAVLTLIGRDHIKAFRSLEAIAREKGKLVAALPADGVAVLNIDDPHVRAIGEACNRKVIWVGEALGATLRLCWARSNWPEPLTLGVEYLGQLYQVRTALQGKHLAPAILSALGVGLAAGVPLTEAISAVGAVKPAEGRMQIVATEAGVTFLRDDWKAPYWSFSAPLEFMAQAQAQRKILVIGTLSDYSLSASKLYARAAREALAVGDIVIFVGPHAPRAVKAVRGGSSSNSNLHTFSEISAAAAFLKDLVAAGDLVLLKGSNKADHLVRLMYHTQNPVHCWLSRCGIQNFCGDCPRLYQGGSSRAEAVSPLAGAHRGPRVIVGLGNSGADYDHTPHNAGFRVLDQLATRA